MRLWVAISSVNWPSSFIVRCAVASAWNSKIPRCAEPISDIYFQLVLECQSKHTNAENVKQSIVLNDPVAQTVLTYRTRRRRTRDDGNASHGHNIAGTLPYRASFGQRGLRTRLFRDRAENKSAIRY